MEEWYDVLGYEGLYEITETGKVRNCKTGTQLSGNINSHGYVVVSLTKNGKKKDCKLHRLLAMTFIPNPYDYDCVNHKDGDKLNNSIDNLEWCTKGYNNRHAREVLQVSTAPKAGISIDYDRRVCCAVGDYRTSCEICRSKYPVYCGLL